MSVIYKFFTKLGDFIEGREIKKAITEISSTAIGTRDAALYVRTVGRQKVEEMREKIENENYPERTRKALFSVISSFDAALVDYEEALKKYDMAWEEALTTIEKTFAQVEDDDDDDDGPE